MDLDRKISLDLATLEDQDEALKDPECAYMFACSVEGADIEKCQEAACKDYNYAYLFACYVEGADIDKIQKLCPEISDKIDDFVMNKVLI